MISHIFCMTSVLCNHFIIALTWYFFLKNKRSFSCFFCWSCDAPWTLRMRTPPPTLCYLGPFCPIRSTHNITKPDLVDYYSTLPFFSFFFFSFSLFFSSHRFSPQSPVSINTTVILSLSHIAHLYTDCHNVSFRCSWGRASYDCPGARAQAQRAGIKAAATATTRNTLFNYQRLI